jgi:hypothetical protein
VSAAAGIVLLFEVDVSRLTMGCEKPGPCNLYGALMFAEILALIAPPARIARRHEA